MQIQVLKKSDSFMKAVQQEDNTVTLLFKKSNVRYQGRKTPIVSIYDENNEYLPCSLKLTHYQSRIPSSLLAKWINANCSEKLLTLKDVCQSEEWVVNGVNKGWMFIKKDCMLYGLHRTSVVEHTVSGCDNHTVVQIDDSVGMQSVLNILKELQIEVECVYNKETQKMEKILITGEGL